ncbi:MULTISPECIES: DUF4136 domain-containing protein [unclassified Shewanella]|uniref:DUF4136 domain-containing protein n=1 Tax=unclassified Shewanella TaxID=196818 RepID=UPI001BC79802|nr:MULTISPECIES: DUF4136 domain-containing protein [unclassified Shewanella]GIU10269.1 hypothetical protein TUM4444_14260 [Shewanella sp. MBTL60-112-B1]GIU32506.1 hypothetical protein TUM4445_18290 [Shewanella sp. MBTL60-112-B2]
MIKQYVLLLLSGLLLLAGCSTTDSAEAEVAATRTTMVTTGDLTMLSQSSKAFSWHPTMFAVHASDEVDNEVVIKHMQAAITQAMQAKGYHLAKSHETPSVLVGFGLALESEMSDKEILKKAGLVAGLSTAGVDDEYEKGSVLVALFSPYNPVPVWRVLAQGFTDLDNSPLQREQRFERLLSTMLQSVPAV